MWNAISYQGTRGKSIDLFKRPALTGLAKLIILARNARVVKLVDALDLGSSPREWLGVRLPPLAPIYITIKYIEVLLTRTPSWLAGFLLPNEPKENLAIRLYRLDSAVDILNFAGGLKRMISADSNLQSAQL
jgi:hypothetical protein